MKFSDIKKFPSIYYKVDVPMHHVPRVLGSFIEEHNLQLCPEFQRGHIWTAEQQTKFIEYALKDPTSGLDIYMNHPGWMGNFNGEFVLVDGLQRLTAVSLFLTDKIKAYDTLYSEFEGNSPNVHFHFHIARIEKYVDVLQWYLDFNSAGTVHSVDELERVKRLIKGCVV